MDSGQYRRGGDKQPSRWGYLLAIVVSALGHLAVAILVLVVLPRWLTPSAPPQAYTVEIVDSIPAGDLGTHLPRLSQNQHHQPPATPQAEESPPAPPPSTPPSLEEDDKDAIALNSLRPTRTPTATPTPTPTPVRTIRPTPRPEPTRAPTHEPTPRPRPTATPTPRPHRDHRVIAPTPTATLTPRRADHRRAKPAPTPAVVVARVEPTPSVNQRLAKVRQQLMAEHLKELKSSAAETEPNGRTNAASGGGPVAAKEATGGKGYGVGPGSGSAGILQDAEFLLYYQQVEKRIKDAWSFAGNNSDLTATVTFGINPDGSLNGVKVKDSSRDPTFDDSVVRAIRRAGPFAPPPEKYRRQFSEGIEASFRLSDLKS